MTDLLPSRRTSVVNNGNVHLEDMNMELLKLYYESKLGQRLTMEECKKLHQFKNILKGETDILMPLDEEEYLLRCLRVRKFNVERSRILLRNFYDLMDGVSDILHKFIPSVNEVLIKSDFLTFGKTLDSRGRLIAYIDVGKWNTRKHSFDDILAASFLCLDEAITSSVEAQVNGIVAIINFKGFSLNHARHFGPLPRIGHLAKTIQDSYPMKVKEIHIMHPPVIFSMLYSVIRPFMKEKLRKRMFVHGSEKAFASCMDLEIVPEEINGALTLQQFRNGALVDSLLQKDDYYKRMVKYGYQYRN